MKKIFFTSCCLLCYLFLKKCLLHFLLLVMLFAPVAKRSISHYIYALKQVFLKQRKHLCCWSRFLIKFQDRRTVFLFKKRLQPRWFFCEYCKNFKRGFFIRDLSFPKIYLMKDNWHFRVIFYYCKLRFCKDL